MAAAKPIPDIRRLAINTATTKKQWGLREAAEHYARAGIAGIDPWRDQVAAVGLADAARIIKDNGLTVTGLCRGGFFPYADAAHKQRNIDDNLKAIDEAAALGAHCLVLVCGGLPQASKNIAEARQMVTESIAHILPHARKCGVPLAIEPLHPMYAADRSVVTSLAEANDICDQLGEGVGIAYDVYHLWWDHAIERETRRAKGRILAFHVCDWLVTTRDLLLDRGMMGDGVIAIPYLRRLVEETGYNGFIEVEIFSERDWWQRAPEEVIAVCQQRYREFV